MSISFIRYNLTNYAPKSQASMYEYENKKLLVYPDIDDGNIVIERVKDDITLLPKITLPKNNLELKFYDFDYQENVYFESEVLAFIYASINEEWDVVKGIDTLYGKVHFWLQCGEYVYDPSLAIITTSSIYSTIYKKTSVIKNEDVKEYLREKDNLYHHFHKKKNLFEKSNISNFSFLLTEEIKEHFDDDLKNQIKIDEESKKEIQRYFSLNGFDNFRQMLTQKRKYILNQSVISAHPNIDPSIIDKINKYAPIIKELMEREYNINADYYDNTLGNCYALSILLNLFDPSFILVQGGIPYKNYSFNIVTDEFYQHSWLEIDGVVYDPALRIVTTKELYYYFVRKEDEYTTEETKEILKRIGFNLTHFRDFMCGLRIGNTQSISYYFLRNKIDTPKLKKQGEDLITTIEEAKKRIQK